MDTSSSWLDSMMGDDGGDDDSRQLKRDEQQQQPSSTFKEDFARMNLVVQVARPSSLLLQSRSKSERPQRGTSLAGGRVEKADSLGGGDSSAASSSNNDKASNWSTASSRIGRSVRRSKSESAFHLTPSVNRSSLAGIRSSVDSSTGSKPENDGHPNSSLKSSSQDTDETADLSVGSGSSKSKPLGKQPAPSHPTPVHVPTSNGDIVLKMVEDYSLLDVPEQWLNKSPQLRQLCSNIDAWRKYSKFRKAVTKGAGYRPKSSSDDDDIPQQVSQDQGNDILKKTDEDLRTLSSLLSYPYPKCIGAYMWPDSAYIRINHLSSNENEENQVVVNSLDMTAMIFSPLAVPRAIHLIHKYDRDAGTDNVVVHATFDYRTVSFQHGKVERGAWNNLVSVEISNNEIVSTNVDGLTRAVSDLRGWLFGAAADGTGASDARDELEGATAILDDYALMSLIFATAFTPLTPSSSYHSPLWQRGIGPTWPSNHMVLDDDKRRINELQLELGKTIRETSWLEYEARRLTGHLRRQDEHFEL
mmetsp:Transcript_25817/g.55959  ORF Transcript_25817/g.55959 Transcript_25817/m.55959 type:complete len:530 (+) Transcript_25817:85-1674(+)